MIHTPPTQYDTLVEAMQELKAKGYRHNFQFIDGQFKNVDTGDILAPDEVVIRTTHRFEGATNPADSSVLYGMETRKGLMGLLVASYGVYSEEGFDEFIKSVETVN